MSQLFERTRTMRPEPDEVMLPPWSGRDGRRALVLRVIGAVAILVVGAVHLEQYVGAHYDSVHVIGPLFLLNFIGATVIGLGLLVPAARLRMVQALLALGGIGLAVTSFVFLFISEHQRLFGFEEHGYRAAIIIALVAEAVTALALASYLTARVRA
jgi:hypothetical protein